MFHMNGTRDKDFERYFRDLYTKIDSLTSRVKELEEKLQAKEEPKEESEN